MTTTVLRAMFAAAGVAAAGAMGMAAAHADDHQADLGSPVDVGGGQQWTVSGLRPSGDTIPYTPAGALWEATATNQTAGGGIPVIPGFAAGNGTDTYTVLWDVPSAQGVNPSSLPAGGSVSGKLYFDVTGGSPNSVSYAVDGNQVAVWVQPPPPPAAAPSYGPAYTAPQGTVPAPAATAPLTPAPAAAPAPATGSQGTPLPATGSQGTPLPATGSQGTPLPATGSQGTPATAQSAPPAAASSPAPASTPASAPASSPAPASTAAAPSTAAASPAPAAGSSGTPLTAPTTAAAPAG